MPAPIAASATAASTTRPVRSVKNAAASALAPSAIAIVDPAAGTRPAPRTPATSPANATSGPASRSTSHRHQIVQLRELGRTDATHARKVVDACERPVLL